MGLHEHIRNIILSGYIQDTYEHVDNDVVLNSTEVQVLNDFTTYMWEYGVAVQLYSTDVNEILCAWNCLVKDVQDEQLRR